jgi:hypothetical protein
MERATQQSYSYSLVDAVCTPKQTLLLPLQYKLAMPDDQFILSSSWLPSPRFELWTLAGYILPQKDKMVCYSERTCQIFFFILHLYISHIITDTTIQQRI